MGAHAVMHGSCWHEIAHLTPRLPHCRPALRRNSRKMSVCSASAEEWITSNLDFGSVEKKSAHGTSGWSTAATYTMSSGKQLFVKEARGGGGGMFEGEARGLQALYGTQTIRVPKVFEYGRLSSPGGKGDGGEFIVMECLPLGGGRPSQAKLGEQIARLHLAEPQDPKAAGGNFGFAVENTCGSTPQPNGWMPDWVDFYRERRLMHQVNLTGDGSLIKRGEKLAANLHKLFEGVEVRPSLLHGDLWSGNFSPCEGGWAVIDPAVYYGHSEAEFGMSWCAGFNGDFWRGYHEVIPKAPGFDERRELYLLYHYLNHTNLFGGSYKGQAESLLSNLLRIVS